MQLSKIENENLQKYLHHVEYKLYDYSYPLVHRMDLDMFPKNIFENIDKLEDITYNLCVPVYDKDSNNLQKIRLIRDNEFNFVLIQEDDLTFIDIGRNLTSEQAWDFIYFFPKRTKTKNGTYCPMNKEIAKLENIKIVKGNNSELLNLIDIYISNYDSIIKKLDEIIDISDIFQREEESLKLFNSYLNTYEVINKNEFLNVENDFINSVININEAEELFNVLDDNSETKIENLLLAELKNSDNSDLDKKYYLELYFKATGQVLEDEFSIIGMQEYISEIISKNRPTLYKNSSDNHFLIGLNIYDEKIYEDRKSTHRYKLKGVNNLQHFEFVLINETPSVNLRYERGKVEYLTKEEFDLLNRKEKSL